MTPPYFVKDVVERMEWRDGDVVVSVPPKSGTTWAMNIIHQFREGGDSDFNCIYAEVPWVEFKPHPETSVDDMVTKIDSMPDTRTRIFKTHHHPPDLPFLKKPSSEDGDRAASKDVKYVVILRNPEEAIASMKPFLEKHSEEFLALWNIPKVAFEFSDFESFYSELIVKRKIYMTFFSFMDKWWKLRNEPNVLMLHFTDMKKDHDSSMKKIADFLNKTPTDDEWSKILEYTSFEWMKSMNHKFEARSACPVPILEPHGMLRRGLSGVQNEDGVTSEISLDLAARGREILKDEVAFDWLYNGGPLP